MEHGFIVEEGGQKQLWLFGLRWQALVERNALRQARRLARQMGAHGWILSGHNLPSVGLSQWRHPGEYSIQISAAAYFAARYPMQQQAAIFKLPSQQYWFVATQLGRVLVRGDYCFAELEAAQAFMSTVLRDHPQMCVLDAAPGYLEWSQFISQAEPSDELEQAQLRTQPRPIRGVGSLLLFLVCAAATAGYWLSNTAAQNYLPEEVTPSQLDPLSKVFQWQPRMVLEPVLQHLYQLPVQAQGWQLQTAQCDFQVQELYWRCESEYQREQKTDLAAEITAFLARYQWLEQAEMVDLDRVRIRQTVQIQSRQVWQRPAPAVTLFQFLGQLQQKQAAFGQINYRQRGVVLPQWAERSQIKLVGPLRSVPLVFDLVLHVHWFHLRLRVLPQAKPNVQRSHLELYLEGAVDDQTVS